LKSQIPEVKASFIDNRSLSLQAENLEFYTSRSLKDQGIHEDSLLIIELKTPKENIWFLKTKDRKMPTKRNFQTFSNNEDLDFEKNTNVHLKTLLNSLL